MAKAKTEQQRRLLGIQPGDLKLEKLPRWWGGLSFWPLTSPKSRVIFLCLLRTCMWEKQGLAEPAVVSEGIWILSVLTFLRWYVWLFLHIWIGSTEIIYAKALWNVWRTLLVEFVVIITITQHRLSSLMLPKCLSNIRWHIGKPRKCFLV